MNDLLGRVMKTVILSIVCLTVFSAAAFAGAPGPQESSTCTVRLPAGVQGFSYVVSNLTDGVEIAAAELLDGGASYALPIGAKIAIYAVPKDGYVVRGANPVVIDEVTAETTLEGTELPTAVEFRMPRMRTLAPFLHEVWYDDYGFDSAGATLSKEEKFACSSARNGNFIGRNLDFFLDDTPEFVVHVAADPAKGRLASVGMAMHAGLREDGVTNGRYTVSYDLVPNRMLDGINEMGVAINQNVVAYDPEVAAGPGQEFHGTNPDGEDLNISFVTRMVLDHATNAAHAVELIKSRNLVGMSVSGDLLHYMISDKDETYVVEIITNSIVARPMRVMTNFCLNWDNGNARALTEADTGWTMADYPAPWELARDAGGMSAITNVLARYYAKHAEGVERFVRLRDNYAEGTTFAGMANLLKRVRYSQAATLETQPYWYSDRTSVAVDELLTEAGYPDAANIRMLYALKYTGNLKLDELLDENLMADERTYLADKDRYRKDDTGVWFTVHNTTYDIARRMFRVVVQEDYGHAFDIWLEPPRVEVAVGDSGKRLGEADPASLATNFTVSVQGLGLAPEEFQDLGFAGYCVRTPGEARGTYVVNFRFTRMPEGFDGLATVVPGVFTITDDEDIIGTWTAEDAAAGYPANGYVHVRLGCDPTMGKVKGEKVYKLKYSKKTGLSSAKVTIKATPAKGYVFAGWYEDPGYSTPATFFMGSGKNLKAKDYRNASQSLTVTDNVYLFARFVEKTTKDDPIVWLRYAGAGYCGADAGWLAETETWYQGVALPTNGCQVAFGSLSLPTVTVSGLPSGVKFDKQTLRFTGAPTAASTEKKPFFTVKISVKNKSGATDVLVKNIRVEPLPAWAVGNFDGYHLEEGVTNGTFTATVGKTGKVSGKTKGGIADTTFSANNFANVKLVGDALCYVADVTVSYKDPATKKTLKASDTLYLVEDRSTGLGVIGTAERSETAEGRGDEDGCGSVGVQRAWDRKDLDYPAFDTKALKEPVSIVGTDLTLKFGAKGKVTVSGKVTGDNGSLVSVSGSTYVLPAEWLGPTCLHAQVYVYVAAKKNLADGVSEVYDVYLTVGADGKFAAASFIPPLP